MLPLINVNCVAILVLFNECQISFPVVGRHGFSMADGNTDMRLEADVEYNFF